MLQEIFYWMFNMSITAAITGLLIMLFRAIKRVPKRITVYLWVIPFLRLILPLGLNSPYSLMTLLSKISTKTIVVYQPADGIDFSMMNIIMAADTYFPISYKINILEKVFGAASVVWLSVSSVMILTLIITYFAAIYEVKDAAHLKDNIYLSEKVISPAVYGIIKPKIILPASYKNRDVELIILHEKTHIRRLDNLWRMIACIVVSVYWFNPFCWLFLKCFLADLELSCDEQVMTELGAEHAKEYALSLLESKQGTTVFASAFGGVKIRMRIENILSFKKLTWFSLTVFIVMLGAIFYVLLTNAG